MTEEEKIATKKARQHESWLRWYKSPKGFAYREKRKQKKLNEQTGARTEQQ